MSKEIDAPTLWRCVDFISDLHLQASDPQTFEAWAAYLHGTPANAVFILGDLFEVWVGDDVLSDPTSFEARCAQTLRVAASKRQIYIMHGNRDFLMGPALMHFCQAQLLADPVVLAFAGERWLLTHGDALCLDDLPYQSFRTTVRNAAWQQEFLAKPLQERQSIARGIRDQSEARKRVQASYADVDSATASQWLRAAHAGHMIHGHTHQPATHLLRGNRERIVLSDWDVQAIPPRAQVLRITPDTGGRALVQRLSPATATEPLH
ncbi:MAG: UDP-2,3-diacylglucosamine diphosphatase [Burkholderiales bacterium]|nr:UDP-2,3-diacylglucosamine diphosphatase [Burkholderiales bacterium]